MKTPLILAILAAGTALSLNSCILASADRTTPPTTGRQLIDLKEARKNGALTESEYQSQKAKLLAGKKGE